MSKSSLLAEYMKSDLERFADWYKENNKMDEQKSDTSLVNDLLKKVTTPVDTTLEWFTTSLAGLGGGWVAAPAVFTLYSLGKASVTMPGRLAPFIQTTTHYRIDNVVKALHSNPDLDAEDILFPVGRYSNAFDFYVNKGIFMRNS